MSMAIKHIRYIQGELLARLKEPVTKKWLHDVRVIIKELKALWAIHPIGLGIKFRKPFPTTISLFKISSKPRDLQVMLLNLKSLPAFNGHPEIEEIVLKKIDGRIKKVKQFLKQKHHRDKIEMECMDYYHYFKAASGFLMKETKKDFRKETYHQIIEVSNNDSHAFHALRKYIKSYGFQQNAFDLNFFQSQEGKAIYQVQKRVGDWHDWHILSLWMEKLKTQMPDIECKKLMEQIRRKEILLRREALKTIKIYANAISQKKYHTP